MRPRRFLSLRKNGVPVGSQHIRGCGAGLARLHLVWGVTSTALGGAWQHLAMLINATYRYRPPLLWRLALVLARVVVAVFGRLRVTGQVPQELRDGPMILAANHIGLFDPIVVAAACQTMGVAPRIMATGGLFRAPVVGSLMRACGHLRVDRRDGRGGSAVEVARRALAAGSVLAAYPEGRIGLDPGAWPERGKTGVARLALACDVVVLPVSQWGAHEVLPWGAPHGVWGVLGRALWRRPVVRVHFGAPVDLSGLVEERPGDAVRGTERIMDAIVAGLVPLRVGEPRLPAWVDRTRPVTVARRYRVGDVSGSGLVGVVSQEHGDGFAGGGDVEGVADLRDAPVGGA